MRNRHQDSEAGFTMVMTVLAMSLVMALAVVTVAAVNGDSRVTTYDLNQKQAYEAAKAGVEDYAFHLTADNKYWEKCTGVPTPSAVNQQGSTTNKRPVPGSTGAEYAIELLPSTTQTTYKECSTANPAVSMLELNGPLSGSFRIRSTGYAGKSKRSIVATFKRPSFLDYVYFTQYETPDPITYASSSWLEAAYDQCEKTIQEGRYSQAIPGSNGVYCGVLPFAVNDAQRGPVHTNDALVICGSASFGRTAADSIEVSAASPGWYAGNSSVLGNAKLTSSCSSASPQFIGTFKTNSPVLSPPSTNSELAKIAETKFKFSGQVQICLNGTTMTVGKGESCKGLYSGAFPANGVIYVASTGSECSVVYSPLTVTYAVNSKNAGCGTAFVKGNYSGQLTIATEKDIVINGALTKANESSILGLIANSFVRIYHPCSTETEVQLDDLQVEAAILAINHQFTVDHYNCGDPMGDLTVLGAIAQKFRGPVATFSGSKSASGYTKNYEYDDRLRYVEPPYFLDPITKSWVIGRETAG